MRNVQQHLVKPPLIITDQRLSGLICMHTSAVSHILHTRLEQITEGFITVTACSRSSGSHIRMATEAKCIRGVKTSKRWKDPPEGTSLFQSASLKTCFKRPPVAGGSMGHEPFCYVSQKGKLHRMCKNMSRMKRLKTK